MEFKKYQEKAWSTALYPNYGKNCDYPIFGLVGEFGESSEKIYHHLNSIEDGQLFKEDITKELGDIFWYISAISRELSLDLAEINNYLSDDSIKTIMDLHSLSFDIGKICEKRKKVMRDKNNIFSDDDKEFIKQNLLSISQKIVGYCKWMQIDPNVVLEKNIEKLFSRKDRGVIGGSGDNR